MSEGRLERIRAAMAACEQDTVQVLVIDGHGYEFAGQWPSVVVLGPYTEPCIEKATGMGVMQLHEWIDEWSTMLESGDKLTITVEDYTAEQIAAVEVEP